MTALPRVLYLGRFDIPGLMERCRRGGAPSNHVHALPDLERLGYRVTGLTPDAADFASVWRFQRRALAALQDCDLVVAHAHYDVRLLGLQRLLRLSRKPVFAFVHSHNVQPWHRLYLPGFDRLWPLSELAGSRLVANGVAGDRISFFPYGADLGYYKAALPWRDEEPPIVLSVGVTKRDFATLIAAADAIRAPIHIVGRVDPADMARASANVTFHSRGNYDLSFADLLALYERAGCVAVVHHGSEHPFGATAIVEAMALGRPLVCTASAGIELDPQRHGTGYTVRPHDPGALAAAINAMLDARTVARGMGAEGRRLTEARFNTRVSAQILADDIEAVRTRAS